MERARSLPGDDLIQNAAESTRSIELVAQPGEVFDWLAQMGFGRAGWYSYDWIDNLGRRSARRIVPEWAVHRAGDSMPGGPIDFTVELLDRPHHLVIGLRGRSVGPYGIDFTLAYQLEPRAPVGTTLTVRARTRIDGPGGELASRALLVGDGIMVRRQLRGLARRCGGRYGLRSAARV